MQLSYQNNDAQRHSGKLFPSHYPPQFILHIDELEVELYLARLESLMDQRPLLLNSVLLRQNPHNVSDWLKRVELLKPRGAREQIAAFMEAITSVDPGKIDLTMPVVLCCSISLHHYFVILE
ncbi:unnamed protein product [Echinostoma caproni]|uniref:Pre-mRNA-splicing factor SYF1 central HAT repeats domain-containing protein n=1 Tax=Echinostoma caproni TaxID=27848 RepID=A0A183A4S6_9TREM|nr:unnamed protein product [Echinostoma caproni]